MAIDVRGSAACSAGPHVTRKPHVPTLTSPAWDLRVPRIVSAPRTGAGSSIPDSPTMNPLTTALLALAIAQTPPARSPYSLEVMPACGQDPKAPQCDLVPVCDKPVLSCRPPKWSSALGAWVRYESRETGVLRYRTIAEAIAQTATQLTDCIRKGDPACAGIQWSDGPRSLAVAALTVAIFESSLREDIQFGRKRGAAGESCLIQVMPSQAPRHASWLGEAERERIARDPEAREAFAKSLLGDSPQALSRCFEIGMRMLAQSRSACSKSPRGWPFGMFSMYGTGATCSAPFIANTRARMYTTLIGMTPRLKPSDLRTLGLDVGRDPVDPTPRQPDAVDRPHRDAVDPRRRRTQGLDPDRRRTGAGTDYSRMRSSLVAHPRTAGL